MEHGNAYTDGAPFNQWFIGDLARWAPARGLPPVDTQLRQSGNVGVKWSAHRAGEQRVDWAPCSDERTVSVLVRGRFLLRFRSPLDRERVTDVRLEKEGDYAIWDTDTEHTWFVEEDSVIVTVRWRA